MCYPVPDVEEHVRVIRLLVPKIPGLVSLCWSIQYLMCVVKQKQFLMAKYRKLRTSHTNEASTLLSLHRACTRKCSNLPELGAAFFSLLCSAITPSSNLLSLQWAWAMHESTGLHDLRCLSTGFYGGTLWTGGSDSCDVSSFLVRLLMPFPTTFSYK